MDAGVSENIGGLFPIVARFDLLWLTLQLRATPRLVVSR